MEFKYEEVAKIAAEAMHNYLMFDKLVKCELVPQDRRSPAVFKGKVRPHRPPGKTAMFKQKKIHNAVKTDEQNQKRQVSRRFFGKYSLFLFFNYLNVSGQTNEQAAEN